MEKNFLKSLDSPKLNACQEFGKFAARLHASRFWGGLDITNLTFEPDGTLKTMFSTGRGRIMEQELSAEQRATDLASVKKQLEIPDEWEAFKLGYRFAAAAEAEPALALVEP